jgi:arginyl-tRNA synthetase
VTPALLDDLVRAAACEVLATRGLDPAALPADVGVERVRNPAHGEYATSLALRTAGKVGVAPRELAGWMADALAGRPEVAGAEVGGPGFLNLWMTPQARGAVVAEVLAAGDDYGLGGSASVVEEAADRLGRGVPAALAAAVGLDVARFGVLRAPEVVLDVAVLARRTLDNPVFLVQYAHARLGALARNAADVGVPVGRGPDLGLLTHPREGELVRVIGEFPAAVRTGVPQRVAHLLEALAWAFLDLHDCCRLLPMGDEQVTALHRARLATVVAARQVLANGLGLLGVSAPERI